MIFDTNVLIYISQNILKTETLFSPEVKPQISIISYIEALGFPFATDQDRYFMEQVCNACKIVDLTDDIIKETISLRSKNKIKLPDAIIYATAVVEKLPLLTNNVSDFASLNKRVKLIDPFTL